MKALRLIVAAYLSMMGLIAGARVIGAMLPMRTEAMQVVQEVRFTTAGWCWRGLCLGTDTIHKAEVQFSQSDTFNDLMSVNAVPDSLLQWRWKANEHRRGSFNQVPNSGNLSLLVFAMEFDRLTLGEVVTLFGVPRELFVQASGVGNDLVFRICFAHGVCAWVVQSETRLRPRSVMHSIDFFNAPTEPISGVTAPELWRGFTSYALR